MISQLVTVIVIVCIAGVVVGQNRLIQFNETYSKWMSQEEVDQLAVECGAGKGFMDITDFPDLGKIPPPRIVSAFPVTPTHQKEVTPLLPFVNKNNIQATVTKLSSYTTRYYRDQTGVDSATWLLNEYKRIAGSRTDIKVEFFPNTFIQPNVIARIEGTGAQKNEIVILGGHIDSISNGATAPGADDDASGSSCVLEVFRVLVENNFKPLRTLEFHGYAGEEAGLLGSQAIATDYLRNARNVYAMLQLDMVGYIATGTTPTIGIITDFTNAAFNTFLRNIVDTYSKVRRQDTVCGYACSDHGSWNKAGYVAAFPFEGTFANRNPRIHTTSDLTNIMNFDHAKAFADIALAVLVELSLD